MKSNVDEFTIDLSVDDSLIAHSDRLVLSVTFTNKSTHTIRFNALWLNFASIVLQVRQIDETPVDLGPPPLPPTDDGEVGRVDLAPGKSIAFDYSGIQLFAAQGPLRPGKYQVRFRYNNSFTDYSEWAGAVETEWLEFDVNPFENLTDDEKTKQYVPPTKR